MKYLVFTLSLTVLLALFSLPAFSLDTSAIEIKQDLRMRTITVNGSLRCDLGGQNTGAPCSIRLIDNTNGRVYDLSNANSAMRLYMDGQKNVSIQGNINGNTLEITQIAAAN